MKKLFLLFLVVGMGSVLYAQDAPLWTVGYRYGKTDFRTPILKTSQKLADMSTMAEISVSRRLTKMLSLAVPIRIGTANLPVGTTGTFTNSSGLMGIDATLQAMPAKYNWPVLPYLVAGLGVASLDKTTNFSAPLGAGLNFKLADCAYFNIESQYRKGFTENRDHWMHKLGLVWFLDENYASDEKEKSDISAAAQKLKLETEAKAAAAIAAANQAKAEAEAKVAAELEAANRAKMEAQAQAEAAARAKAEAQAKAQAEAAARAKAEADAKAKAAAASTNAVRDTDGDGVPDSADNCPTIKGTAANKGCPEENRPAPVVTVETQKVLTEALEGVQFETGSAILKASSYAILDKVTAVMAKNPSYNLSINGHTDATGNEAANQKLSSKRAMACLSYLASKGIAEARMSATGYGSSQPIMDNKTPEGRAKNRRVEFKIR